VDRVPPATPPAVGETFYRPPPWSQAVPEATPLTLMARWFYRLLLVTGVAFYLIWNAVYGCWNLFDPSCVGVYTVTVLLVAFGIVGSLLYAPKKATQ